MNENITRVALICKNEFQAGGASTYEANLISYLVGQENSQIEFVIFEPSKMKRSLEYSAVVFYSFGPISQFFAFTRSLLPKSFCSNLWGILQGNLARKLNENSIDIAYFLSPNPVALGLFSIPVITTVWDLGHRENGGFRELASFGNYRKREHYYSRTLLRSKLVITDSDVTSSKLVEFYKVHPDSTLSGGLFPKITDVNNGAVKHFSSMPYPYIIYPAQFWPHKNHEFLLELMHDLKQNFSDLKLVLTGSDKGNLEIVQRRIRALGLDNDVKILGFVESEYLCHLISNAELMVFPSLLGPTNLPPLESLILGTPVVVTDKNSDLIHSPENGIWVVSEDSKKDYIQAISSALLGEHEIKRWSFESANKNKAQEIIFRLKADTKLKSFL